MSNGNLIAFRYLSIFKHIRDLGYCLTLGGKFMYFQFNSIALRMAKTLWSFGNSECNRVKTLYVNKSTKGHSACALFLFTVPIASSLRSRTTSTSGFGEFSPVPLSAEHKPEICLQCGKPKLPEINVQLTEISEG